MYEMYSYRYFEEILESLGLKDHGNICDFWFGHIDVVSTKVNHQMKTHMDRFGLEVRWKSPIGLACNEAVRKFLNEKQRQHLEILQAAVLDRTSFSLVEINFFQFQFQYENEFVSLESFVGRFPTSKFTGLSDLRGINLTKISIQNAVISNANFAYGNFQGSHLFQLTLHNVNFVSADLSDSFIGNVTLDGMSGVPGANFKGTFVNILRGLNDDRVAYPFKYEPVSAFYLIGALIRALFTDANVCFDNERKHTKFLANDVSALTAPDNKMLRRYIDWYQYVFSNFASLRSQSIADKLFFSLSIVTTKGWSSYVSLAVTGLALNLLFALLFYTNHSNFNGLDDKYLSAFYYSVVTFTTLGYGDITPQGGWARLLVIIEVALGYVTLGVFVYLLSRKVGDKF